MIWNRDWKNKYGPYSEYTPANFLCFRLNGMTLSGDALKTTFGNSMRSLLYDYFYLESIGIREPWR